MLTFPGAPPDIGCTWVHYSFSTTFGSRRVRTSVCVSLVVDDTTCTCAPFPCVPSYRYASLFSLFRCAPLSPSHPSLSSPLRSSPARSSSSLLAPRCRPSLAPFTVPLSLSRSPFFTLIYLPLLSSPSRSLLPASVHPPLGGYFRLRLFLLCPSFLPEPAVAPRVYARGVNRSQ